MTSVASSASRAPVGAARLELRHRGLVVAIRLVACRLPRRPARVLAVSAAEATG